MWKSYKSLLAIIFSFSIIASVQLQAQWTEQTSPTTSALYSVAVVDDNIAWIGGAAGTVLQTTNAGATWASVGGGAIGTADIYNIFGIDAQTALCTTSPAATYIYRTTNGGTTWTQVFFVNPGFFDAIWMFDSNNGFVYGDPQSGHWELYKTTDGGATWTAAPALAQAGSEAGWNNAMYVSGSNIYFGTNNTRIYYSSDGGNSWAPQTTTGQVNSYAVWFNNATVGLMGGSTGGLDATTNGGTTWTPITSPGAVASAGITGVNNDWWFAQQANPGVIYYSTNNGANWTTDYTSPSGQFYHIAKSRNGNWVLAVQSDGGISSHIIIVTTTFQLSVNVANGWNMVSVPGINTDGMTPNDWWINHVGNVYKFSGGYVPIGTTAPGEGYWMKNNGAQTYNTGDEWPAGGIQIVAHNPIPGTLGWNMIGPYEQQIISDAAHVTSNPAGNVVFPIYKYSGGYQPAATLDPGYGYWVKLSAAAQIIFVPGPVAKGTEPVEYFPEDWGRIILTDAAGVNYTLYAVKGEVDLSRYELPPAPPTGMFDIRFGSGRIAEDINSAIQTIDMSGVTYPLTVRVEGMDIRLQDETGKSVNANLKTGQNIVIRDATINKLMVTGELIPAEYTLEQNYPNPFNPSTKINYSVPEAGNVKLAVYNIVGEEVAVLVNGFTQAGSFDVTFNASNLPSGVYLYKLQSANSVQTKKMILLK